MTIMIKQLTYYPRRIAGYSLAIITALLISASPDGGAAPSPVDECVTIEAPVTACGGKEFKFVARIASGSTLQTPTYHWSLSGGLIVRGQGTPQVVVKGYTGKNIQAEVEVGGLGASCSKKARSSEVRILSCRAERVNKFETTGRSNLV